MWIVVLIVGGAFVGLFLYGVIGTASWLWQFGEAVFESIRMKNDIRRRNEEHEAKQPMYEAQRQENLRIATILTQRFVAHVLSIEHGDKLPWTLEKAHRAWRQSRTVAEMRELAENIGLREFYTYDPYALEINTLDADAVMYEYGKMLGQIDLLLQELIREYGSAKSLADVPALAGVVGALGTRNS